MILFINDFLFNFEQQGKDYKWQRPEECSKCHSKKLYGHGYVSRYFNQIKNFLFFKRWRCQSCGAVITCRPAAYWQRYQTPISDIFSALQIRFKTLKWPPWITRQRGGHWMRSLNKKLHIHYELLKEGMLETLAFFVEKELTIF